MSKPDGGSAFPGVVERPAGGVPGMSLRDYFAGQVISQCTITVIREEPEPDAEVIRIYAERFARTAYVIADAMIAEREK